MVDNDFLDQKDFVDYINSILQYIHSFTMEQPKEKVNFLDFTKI